MNILVLYSETNSKGKSDATGAFIPEARAFVRTHQDNHTVDAVGMKLVGVPRWKRKAQTLAIIEVFRTLYGRLDAIAFFGHGWPNGIQFGFLRKDIPELCDHLTEDCSQWLRVILYACLTAENDVRDTKHKQVGPGTDGGFADLLRDGLVRRGVTKGWADAHKTKGHASWNPYLVRMLCEDVDHPEFGAEGGAWIVEPRSQYWKKWCNKLKGKPRKGHFRYRFPFMTELEIRAELAGIDLQSLVPGWPLSNT